MLSALNTMKTFSAEFGVNGESVYEYQRSHLFMVNKNTDLYFTHISHARISVSISKVSRTYSTAYRKHIKNA